MALKRSWRELDAAVRCSDRPIEAAMDDLKKKTRQDRSKINMHEEHEVRYWDQAPQGYEGGVAKRCRKVGNSAATVRKELAIP